MELDGFHLDAHSDVVPPELIDLAAQVLPRLPNLGALVFEILPSYVLSLGLDRIRAELATLHELWKLRPLPSNRVEPWLAPRVQRDEPSLPDDVPAWEQSVAAVARGSATHAKQFAALDSDAGGRVLRQLVTEFRRGSIARGLRFTLSVLVLTRTEREVTELLDDYCRTYPADPFVAVECDRFARFLSAREPESAQPELLRDVLRFERALLAATLRGETSQVSFERDPASVFEALEQGRLPERAPRSPVTFTVGAAPDLGVV
jgi:hypothetical protein